MTALRTALPLALWALVIVIVGAIIGAGATSGQEPNHASLIVVYPDGRVDTLCVEFSEETISGAELLRRSGLSVVLSGSGGLGEGVCRIGDTGCSDPGDCFCQCTGGECAYWSYFTLNDNGEWRYQNVGASQRTVRNGDVDVWVWGSGQPPPSGVGPAAGCGPATTSPAQPAQERPPAQPTAAPQSQPQPLPQDQQPASPEPTQLDQQAPDVDDDTSVVIDAPTPTSAPPRVNVRDAVDRDVGRFPEDEVLDLAEDDRGGVPASLIAFGVVATALAGGIGALALRRRLSG